MSVELYKYCNQYSKEQEELNYIVKGKQLKIFQNTQKGIGFTFWTTVPIYLF